jgi:hypothetical protein
MVANNGSALSLGGNNPDGFNTVTKVHDEIKAVSQYFGEPIRDVNPSDSMQTIAESLHQAFNNKKMEPVKTIIHEHVVRGDGWWYRFAPARRMDMNQPVDLLTWERQVMPQTPEDVPPQFVTHRSERTIQSLQRYELGARFKMDFFKQPEAVPIWRGTITQLISSTFAAAKIQTTYAVTKAKQHWKVRNQEEGRVYESLDRASLAERTHFGALNKYSKALYKLNIYVSQIMDSDLVKPNMVVFPKGTLDLIAQNSFHTEAFRVGESTQKKSLVSGGSALVDAIPGMTLYEDERWSFSNTGGQEFEQFYKRTTIGQYYFVSGAKDQVGDSSSDFPVSNMLSFQCPSMERDAWETVNIKRLVDGSMRYDGDGRLSHYHEDMLDNLDNLTGISGLNIYDNLLDPYVWKSDASSSSDRSPRGQGYRVVEHWGDVDPRHYDIKDQLAHGLRSKMNILKSGILSHSDVQKLLKLKLLARTLNEVDDIDSPSVQGFAAAVAMNPENAVGGNVSFFLRANRNGGVQLPNVDIDGGQARMFINVNGVALYMSYQTAGADDDGHGHKAGDIISYSAVPVADLGAKATGNLSNHTPIIAPKRPSGFGNVVGLRTLAQLHKNADNRGWDHFDKDMLQTAAEGMDLLDRYFLRLRQDYKMCEYFDPRFVPEWAKSGDSNLDSLCVAQSALFFDTPFPTMVRVPDGVKIETIQGAGAKIVEFDNGKITEIGTNMGFNMGGGASPASVLGGSPQMGAPGGTLATIAAIKDILTRPELDSSIKEQLLADGGLKLFSAYANSPLLGQSPILTKEIQALQNTNGRVSSFAHLWVQFIANEADTSKRAKVFSGVLLLAANSSRMSNELRRAYIDQLKRSVVSGSRKRSTDDHTIAVAIASGNGTDSAAWVNSRLTISEKVWQALGRSTQGNANKARRVYQMIIRPADPRNPTLALGGDVHPAGDVATNVAEITNTISRLTFARAKMGAAGVFDNNNSSKRQAGSGLYAPISRAVEDMANGLSFGGFSDGPHRIPLSMAGAPPSVNPFVDQVDYVDSRDARNVGSDIVQKKWLVYRLNELDNETDELVRIPAQLLALCKVHKDVVYNWIDRNLPIPFSSFVVAQPWIRLRMGAALWAEGGSSTAENGYNYEDVVLQLNGLTKNWTLNYSTWLGCCIYDPSKFIILSDVLFAGYMGGYDTRIFSNPDSWDFRNPNVDEASMFIFDCGGGLTAKDVPEPLTLSMRYHDRSFPYNLSNRQEVFERDRPLLPCAFYYLNMWGFHGLNSTSVIDRTTFEAERRSTFINEVMYSGPQRNWDTTTRDYTKLSLGKGHIGKFFFVFPISS